MVSGEPGFYDTRAAALWDDEFLYVAFWAEEPFVRASLTERDSLTKYFSFGKMHSASLMLTSGIWPVATYCRLRGIMIVTPKHSGGVRTRAVLV
jgi:hypothetical protein